MPSPAPASPYTAVRQDTGAVFFRRSRLFLREAAFFSGGEGCEWRAQRVTVGASGRKPKNTFLAFSHSMSHERALALTSPPPDFLFSSIPQTPSHKPHSIPPKPHPLLRLKMSKMCYKNMLYNINPTLQKIFSKKTKFFAPKICFVDKSFSIFATEKACELFIMHSSSVSQV